MKANFALALICLSLLSPPPSARAQSRAAAAKAPAPSCFIAEFRSVALSTHDPGTRSSLALDWLNRNAMACSLEKLTLINANRASWMGTSDSHLIAGILDSMMEFKIAGKPEMLAQIFGSLGKEGVAGVHMVVASPVPRAEPQPTYGTPYPPQPGYPQAAYPPHYQPQPAYPQATYPQPNPEGR